MTSTFIHRIISFLSLMLVAELGLLSNLEMIGLDLKLILKI